MLRERLRRSHEASLCINESLEIETVLQVVVDSARRLTGAQYGVIAPLVSEVKQLASGMTEDEAVMLWNAPDGERLLEFLRQIDRPMRLRDFEGYVRSHGHPKFRLPAYLKSPMSFLSAPIHYQGQSVGNFFCGVKTDGKEFTADDEEILVMFATQAALAISNAVRHREEKRAKADLETVINTSPVGVLVFDGKTGVLLSDNLEVKRIAEGLITPGQSLEQLLQVITLRRADGREISFGEHPITHVMRSGETVRAEEVVLLVPDGRRLTTLVNATPILSEDGTMESLVVTLQDMTPLEELERLRGEFLAVISHDLRTPLAAIKGSATTALEDTPSRDAAEIVEFFRIISQQADHMNTLINDLLDISRIETGTLKVHLEPVDVVTMVEQARDAFLRAWSGRDVYIDLAPGLARVMADRRRIVQVLGNLFANASHHSPITSSIRLSAAEEGTHVEISVVDQGRGVPPERLPHLFKKFAAPDQNDLENDVSGPGWGLAICRGIVEAHGGRISVHSDGLDKGTRVTFSLPIAEEGKHTTQHLEPAPSTASRGKKTLWKSPILVVDDDPQTLRQVRNILSKEGYPSIVTGNSQDVPKLMEENHPALVVMDLVMPGMDGVEVMTNSLKGASVPVIFLSAYGHEQAMARAFEAGAVDYIVKPFSPTELAVRIKAALRNWSARPQNDPEVPFVMGDLTIDYACRQVTVAGRPVRLTHLEYRLLVELSVNAGYIVSYEDLLLRVWDRWGQYDTRTLRSTVKKIRKKLGDNAKIPIYIFNRPNEGYGLGMEG